MTVDAEKRYFYFQRHHWLLIFVFSSWDHRITAKYHRRGTSGWWWRPREFDSSLNRKTGERSERLMAHLKLHTAIARKKSLNCFIWLRPGRNKINLRSLFWIDRFSYAKENRCSFETPKNLIYSEISRLNLFNIAIPNCLPRLVLWIFGSHNLILISVLILIYHKQTISVENYTESD